MSLLFAHPGVAWFLPAVTLPILFHLFFRLKRTVREFPSLMFFTRIDPKLSAKRKVHEWIILFLRCLFIFLVILALMRPRIEVGSGGHVARVVLIDNSASMAASARDGATKLSRAAQFAEKMVSSTRTGDATAVQLMIPDAMAAVPRGLNADRGAVREALEKLPTTNGAANVGKSIRSAMALLSTAKQPVRELHVVTDLQKRNWGRGELEAQPAGEQCRIIIHRMDSAPLKSGWVALEVVQVPDRTLPMGRVTPVRFALHNYADAAALVRLNATDDSGRNFSRDLSVPPGQLIPAVVTFSFTAPGFHWARAWIEGDVAAGADRVDLGFWCSEPQKMVFVGGREKYAALPFAVAPGGNSDLSGIEAVSASPEQLASELASKPLAVAVTWEDWPQDNAAAKALEDFVRKGGTLFVVPAPEAGATIGRALAPWLGASAEAQIASKEAETLMAVQAGDPFWNNVRDADGKPNLGALRAFRYRPLKLGKDWKPLLSNAGGSIVLARRTLGKGTIYASGLAFTPKWSSLPMKAGFVVLVQNAVFGERTETIPVQAMEAGEDLRFELPSTAATVRSLAGQTLSWEGAPGDFSGVPRAGVYEVRQKDKTRWVAVRAVADEAAPDFITGRSIPFLKNVAYDTIAIGESEGDTGGGISGRAHTALYGPLLAAALLVLLIETWLANERGGSMGRQLFESLLPETMRRKLPKNSKREVARR